MEKGARLGTLEMRQAVVCERVDVIRFFMGSGVMPDADGADGAEGTGNEELVGLVRKWNGDKGCVVS